MLQYDAIAFLGIKKMDGSRFFNLEGIMNNFDAKV